MAPGLGEGRKSAAQRIIEQNQNRGIRPNPVGVAPDAYNQAAARYFSANAEDPVSVYGTNVVSRGRFSDYIPGAARSRYEQNAYRSVGAAELKWFDIVKNPVAMEQLRQVYNVRYRQEADYKPSQSQLQNMYYQAIDQAATPEAVAAGVTTADVLRAFGTYDIFGQEPGGGTGGGGPTSFVTHANESDVRALADSLAQEMIGRTISDKEFKRMYKRVRKEEMESPRTTRIEGGVQVTETGMTDLERQEVLQEVLREKPEWEQYQMTTGVLDAMNNAIQATGVLDSGI